MRPCPSCHKEHSMLLRCEVAARIAEAAARHGRATVIRELRKAVPDMVGQPKTLKQSVSVKTEAPDCSRSDDREAGNGVVPTVTHGRTNAERQRDWRNAHAEQVRGRNRERMDTSRAVASGRAERYPRA